jgi:DNA polymerase I-like protein with 3'-5' exonuclease and polymerase domains
MKLILDVENTVTKRDDKMHLDPFEKDNQLIMVGCLTEDGKQEYLYHCDTGFDGLQNLLDRTTILIGHNISYDLMWLWECGFKYDGDVFDTMLAEYILLRGQKKPLSLEACAERYDLETKKQDTLKEYFKKGLGVDEIPKDELSSYLSSDLHATRELYISLNEELKSESSIGLLDTIKHTNSVCITLAEIYKRGFNVDVDELNKVRNEFQTEKVEIEKRLSNQVKQLMGDTPINLNSPEQMSWVIYSRKPKDKSTWLNNFTPYMSKKDLHEQIKENSDIVYKTNAVRCNVCYGTGILRKVKKDGTPYKNQPKCSTCTGTGYLFKPTNYVAGLKFNAPTVKWVSANGFSVNKNMLSVLQHVSKRNDSIPAYNFLTDLQRLSALDTYLSSFVDGIKTHIKDDNKLHVRLLQHRTATGRFSGADPNMQNMPRGGTFPVKKVFVSRWKGGKIMEADFAQLEFRTAAYLAQDKIAMKEIEDGFDVHSYTAKVISEAGQKISRQEAKGHTFAPLFGATGFGRTTAEAKYYEQFTKKYKGIASWHSKLAKEALTNLKIKTPSGREFAFPDVVRRLNGGVSHFTQIKNYPVQSFATADIVPLILMDIDRRLNGYKSCVVNTVHDSIVIDVHPDEVEVVKSIIEHTNSNMTNTINNHFSIKLNVPLLLEAKIGNNWLDMKDVV